MTRIGTEYDLAGLFALTTLSRRRIGLLELTASKVSESKKKNRQMERMIVIIRRKVGGAGSQGAAIVM